MRTIWRLRMTMMLSPLLLTTVAAPASAKTYLVTTASDDGAGSLRQAILDANEHPGKDMIVFAIPASGVQTLQLRTELPQITDRVTLDATTQGPGHLIVLDGSQLGDDKNGIFLSAGSDGSIVHGFIIHGFRNSPSDRAQGGNGILVADSNYNTLTLNWVGLDASGTLGAGLRGSGIYLVRSKGNVVGTAVAPNIVAATGQSAISLWESDDNIIQGNCIGTDKDCTGFIGLLPADEDDETFNVGYGSGIFVGSGQATGPFRNVIGGRGAGQGNVITGSAHEGGIRFRGAYHRILGNFIGTDRTGRQPLGYNDGGLGVDGDGTPPTPDDPDPPSVTHDNLVEGNVISGSNWSGVIIFGNADHNVFRGNFIGTDITGTQPIPNGASRDPNEPAFFTSGIECMNSNDNNIFEDNVIAFNRGAGIVIHRGIEDEYMPEPSSLSVGNQILQNAIFANGGVGIDLSANPYEPEDGVTPNGSSEAGPNHFQHFPVLTTAEAGPGWTLVRGGLDSTPSTGFSIRLYASPANEPREAKTFLGRIRVTTDATGHAELDRTVTRAQLGDVITATATNDSTGDTSELSDPLAVTASPDTSGN